MSTNAAVPSPMPSDVITRLREEDKCEFFLSSELQPTVLIPNDPFRKEWPVDSQRVRDLVISRCYEMTNGTPLKLSELGLTLSLMREECREGGRRLTEEEAVKKEGDVVVQAVLFLMNTREVFKGKTVDLLSRLRGIQSEGKITDSEWLPVFVNIFSGRLRRLVPALKGYGVEVTLEHKEDGSHCTLRRLPTFAFEPNGEARLGLTDASNRQAADESSVGNGSGGKDYCDPDGADAEIRKDDESIKRTMLSQVKSKARPAADQQPKSADADAKKKGDA